MRRAAGLLGPRKALRRHWMDNQAGEDKSHSKASEMCNPCSDQKRCGKRLDRSRITPAAVNDMKFGEASLASARGTERRFALRWARELSAAQSAVVTSFRCRKARLLALAHRGLVGRSRALVVTSSTHSLPAKANNRVMLGGVTQAPSGSDAA